MNRTKIQIQGAVSFDAAETAARQEVAKFMDAPELVSWSDRLAGKNGPLETCSGENAGCSASYARGANVKHRVSVNGADFEFYYTDTPAGSEELDPEQVEAVHSGIEDDTFNNVQGG